MHNFPLLFLCEKEKNQNTSDMYCKKYRKMLDYAHRHKTSDEYKKLAPESPEMSDENAGKPQYSSGFHGMHHKRGPVLGYHADAARQKTQIYWEVNPLCLKELYSTRPALSWQQ